MTSAPSCIYLGDLPQLVPFLLRLFSLQDQVKFCASAVEKHSALEIARIHGPEVILVDFESQGGWSLMLLPEIKKITPGAACLVPTDMDTPGCRRVAESWGADGLVLKEDMGTTLVQAIKQAITVTHG